MFKRMLGIILALSFSLLFIPASANLIDTEPHEPVYQDVDEYKTE